MDGASAAAGADVRRARPGHGIVLEREYDEQWRNQIAYMSAWSTAAGTATAAVERAAAIGGISDVRGRQNHGRAWSTAWAQMTCETDIVVSLSAHAMLEWASLYLHSHVSHLPCPAPDEADDC